MSRIPKLAEIVQLLFFFLLSFSFTLEIIVKCSGYFQYAIVVTTYSNAFSEYCSARAAGDDAVYR